MDTNQLADHQSAEAFKNSIDETIEFEREELLEQAKRVAEKYYADAEEMNEQKGQQQQYELRVWRDNEGKGGLRIEWKQIAFIRRGGKAQILRRSIARGRGAEYTNQKFPKATPEQKQLIRQCEKIMGQIRKRNIQLSKLSQASENYRRTIIRVDNEIEQYDKE